MLNHARKRLRSRQRKVYQHNQKVAETFLAKPIYHLSFFKLNNDMRYIPRLQISGNFVSTIVVQCRLSFLSHPRTSVKTNVTNFKLENRTTSNKEIKRNGKCSYEICNKSMETNSKNDETKQAHQINEQIFDSHIQLKGKSKIILLVPRTANHQLEQILKAKKRETCAQHFESK